MTDQEIAALIRSHGIEPLPVPEDGRYPCFADSILATVRQGTEEISRIVDEAINSEPQF